MSHLSDFSPPFSPHFWEATAVYCYKSDLSGSSALFFPLLRHILIHSLYWVCTEYCYKRDTWVASQHTSLYTEMVLMYIETKVIFNWLLASLLSSLLVCYNVLLQKWHLDGLLPSGLICDLLKLYCVLPQMWPPKWLLYAPPYRFSLYFCVTPIFIAMWQLKQLVVLDL